MYLGLAQPTPPPGGPIQLTPGPVVMVVPIKRIECSLLQLARISFGAGKVATADGVRKVIEEDGADAYYALVAAGHTLEPSERNDVTRGLFRAIFGRSPDELPHRRAQLDYGRIVAERFARTHQRTFIDGQVVVSCWGWPWPWPWPGSAIVDQPEKYRVRAHENIARIGVGAEFWKDRLANDRDSLGAALLGAGMTIRYGLSLDPVAPPFRNVHCYLRFGFGVMNVAAPGWVTAGCDFQVALRRNRGGQQVGGVIRSR